WQSPGHRLRGRRSRGARPSLLLQARGRTCRAPASDVPGRGGILSASRRGARLEPPDPVDARPMRVAPDDRAAAIFLALSSVPPGERARVLEARCGGDAALRHDVERLLARLETGDALPD